jgi:hypothetical protein
MARERATAEVGDIEADHSPFLSATSELVGLLERFAAAARFSAFSYTALKVA